LFKRFSFFYQSDFTYLRLQQRVYTVARSATSIILKKRLIEEWRRFDQNFEHHWQGSESGGRSTA